MKSILITIVTLSMLLLFGCEHLKKHLFGSNSDNKIMLKTDTLNSVTMKDTMFIYENACRGCAYEHSIHFSIEDTANVVALHDVITTDSNPENMDGGSVSKDLIIVPKKIGSTTIKMHKFSNDIPDAKDSTDYTFYRVEVRK